MPDQKISEPFRYKGYSERSHQSYQRTSAYIPLSDGANLAADIYLPDGYLGQNSEPITFPVVFVLSPYNRANVNRDTGEVEPINFQSLFVFGAAPVPKNPEDNIGFPHYGFACVVADTRGHGASIGENPLSFGWRYQKDAGEAVDWISQQSWCDGNVGMIGASHVAWTQLAAASSCPEALKAIMPAVAPLDGFTEQYYPGGILMQGFVADASPSAERAKADRKKWVCAPVGDAPLPKNAGNFGNVLKGKFDHAQAPYIDTRATTGENGKDLLSNMLLPISKSGVAIYNIGAWFDAFIRGTCQRFSTLQRTNESKLAIYPGFHGIHSGFMYDYYGVSVPDTFTERRRFLDHYLKGIDNGINREPPVLIYVMNGEGWRQENQWPLARETRKIIHLGSEKSLSTDLNMSSTGKDRYQIQLDHDRLYGENRSSRWSGMGGVTFPRGLPDMSQADRSSLFYTSAPLVESIEVTGHPIVNLHLSCDTDDADIYVFLEDVAPNGRSLLVTEGLLRAGFFKNHDPNEVTDTSIDIVPKLPWHGFRKQDYDAHVFSGGKIIEMTIDLMPTSWVFKTNHSIRLSIACANWPDFALHPSISPRNDPLAEDNKSASIYLHYGPDHPSKIDLPVIPTT